MIQVKSPPQFAVSAQKLPLWLRTCFWMSVAISVAIVLRRLIALQQSPSADMPPDLARLDAWFRTHASLTRVHILTSLAFVCVLPFVFAGRTRHKATVHRTFYLLGAAVALTAYGMTSYSVGGWVERAAVLLFDTLFATELLLGFRAFERGEWERQRRWTLRATATVLGIATTRPVMGIFFATSRLTHWTPEQFFGPAFWIGFTINVAAMELWLRAHPHSQRGNA